MRFINWTSGVTLFGLVLLAALVGAGVLAVQHLQVDKRVELLATVVANLFGTVIGAALAFWFALRQLGIQAHEAHAKSLVDATFDLHREFNSGAMNQARTSADIELKKHPLEDLDQLYKILPPDQYSPIWEVIHFYSRLLLAIKHHRIQKELVPELFGSVFYGWYITCYQTQLVPLGYDAGNRMAELRQWFDVHSPEPDIKRWVKFATRDRAERVAAFTNQ